MHAVVSQSYTANVWEEHVIRGNSALMKCNLPAFVGDFVTVSSWFQDDTPIDKNDVYGRFPFTRHGITHEGMAGGNCVTDFFLNCNYNAQH